jgi:two-component system, chemotaxis family, protein-glutamate methylesterase/glutaminase
VIKKVRVLVVDDSGYVISTITRRLQNDPEIEVIGSARNGVEAIEKVKELKPDVVTMDVVMPEMDGITALEHIMAECPTPVVMLSALTSENAETTIKALEKGAVDFYLKPSIVRPVGTRTGDENLAEKLKAAARTLPNKKASVYEYVVGPGKKAVVQKKTPFNKMVIIGSSTGGPKALMELVPNIPADISAAILIVQHMPPIFTNSLAERLNQASEIEVVEAREGDSVNRGTALMAPGGYHMIINGEGRISLNQEPPVQGVRPAVDVTMKSVAGSYGDKSLGVVLTGMGSDGTLGSSYIKTAGGKVLAQDEATSAIYGMPKSVVRAGFADKIIPLDKMAKEIFQSCNSQE